MANQADGSIVIDTELSSDGFKAGSSELLNAIKSLTSEVKALGQSLKDTFSGSDRSIGQADERVQALETEMSRLQAEAQSLKATISQLQEKLTALSNAEPAAPAIDFDAEEAEAKIAALESKVRELETTIANLESESGEATPVGMFGGTTEKASTLQRQIEALSGSVDRLNPAFQKALGGSESALASFETKAGAVENKIVDLWNKLNAAGRVRMPTEEYQRVSAEVTKLEQKFDALLARQEKMQAMGVKERSNQWKSLQYDMEVVSQKYHELLALKQQLETSGAAYVTGADTAQYAQMEANLAAANQRLIEMRSALGQSGGLMSRVAGGARNVFSWIGRAARSAAGGLVSGVKAAASGMLKMVANGKSMKRQFAKLASTAKMFGMSLLGARGVYMLLRKAVSAYMQENQELSNQLSACWSSIGSILGPIITRLINLVASAVSYVTQFLRLLGIVGKSTSKAIGSAGSAASGEADKLKRQLASFDELNVLSDNSSGGGGGAGGAGASSEMPEVELPDWVQIMVNQLKAGDWGNAAQTLTEQLNQMVDNVDWAGAGSKLAYGMDGVLLFIATTILTFDWYSLGANLGLMLNNLIYGVDWANLGVVLGAKFLALLGILGGLFATVDWPALGKALADGFMGLWNSVDWKQAAHTLSNGLIGTLNGLSSVIKNVDWQKLGNNIATFVAEVDYGGVFAALCDGIGAALGGLARFILGLVEGAWASVVDWWYATAYEDGAFTMEGLLLGIWNGICNIAHWIKTNIFDPFIKGFKEAFGIASPSKVMAEQGDFIVAGLLQGITAAWKGIGQFFTGAVSGIKKAFDGQTWANIGSNITSGIKNGIKNGWTTLTSWIKEKARSLLDAAKSALGIHSPSRLFRDQVGLNIGLGIGEGIENAEGSILGSVSGVADAIANEFNANSYTPGDIGMGIDGAVLRGLDAFSNKIADSFDRLLDRLQAIANSTSFTVPRAALGSIVPYAAQSDPRRGTDSGAPMATIQEAVAVAMEDVVQSNIAGHEATVAILQQILEAVLGIEIDGETISKAVDRYNRKMAVIKG